MAHTKADTGRSGIGQIQHAGIRIPLQILDAIGSTFLPGLTSALPGTELHHHYLVNQKRADVNQEQKTMDEEARRQLETAQAAELGPRGEHERASAEALTHPKPKLGTPIKTNRGYVVPNETDSTATPLTVNGEQVQAVDEKGVPLKTIQNEDGTWHVLHDDGTTSPVTHDGKPFMGKTTDPKQTPEERAIAEYQAKHPGASVQDARQATKIAAPEHPPQALMIGPDGDAVLVRPGTHVAPGSQTTAGVNATSTPTMQMRNVAAQAGLVHEQTPHMLSEIDRLKDKIGPMAGRWNEVMQGKVGLHDPDFAGFRADLLMYSSAVALMHARGRLPENLREEFDRAINAPKQDFGNLKAVVTRIDDWTTKNMKAMGAGGPAGGATGAVRKYNPATGKLE